MTLHTRAGTFEVRRPRQARSVDSWDRILEAGIALLMQEGWEALTITSVCKKAGVTPPTIYARVDGLGGLFWAVYELGMRDVLSTQSNLLAIAAKTPPGSASRVQAVVHVAAGIFEKNKKFLQPIIRYSSSNNSLLAKGAKESRSLVLAMADLLPGKDRLAAFECAQHLYTEAVFRVMYGGAFLSEKPESFKDFESRLLRAALSRLGL